MTVNIIAVANYRGKWKVLDHHFQCNVTLIIKVNERAKGVDKQNRKWKQQVQFDNGIGFRNRELFTTHAPPIVCVVPFSHTFIKLTASGMMMTHW